MNITTSRGPSAKNQTSDDHSANDPGQLQKQPTTEQIIEADGLNINLSSSGDINLEGKDDETAEDETSTVSG